METLRRLVLPTGWLSSDAIEPFFCECDAAQEAGEEVLLVFDRDTKLLSAAGLRALAYLNQWAARSDRPPPKLVFENLLLFRYLDRNGFLACLDPRIATEPERPFSPASVALRGAAGTVVEVVLIPADASAEIPRRVVGEMTDKVIRAVPGLSDELRNSMSNKLWGALTELIGNVGNHSETRLPGYATLQVYPKAQSVQAVVCDSGVGIPATLRVASGGGLSDEQLLRLAIERGMSRRGSTNPSGYGCGLKLVRDLVSHIGGKIAVRVPTMEFRSDSSPRSATLEGTVVERRAQLEGTHIVLELRLDSVGWRD